MAHGNRLWRWFRAVGITACAALAVVYFLDPRWTLYDPIKGVDFVSLYGNGIEITQRPIREEFVSYADFSRRWWIYAGFGPGAFVIFVPTWVLFLALALPTAYAWHRCRRFGPGHCSKCGYDLAGIAVGICPECGKEVKRPRR